MLLSQGVSEGFCVLHFAMYITLEILYNLITNELFYTGMNCSSAAATPMDQINGLIASNKVCTSSE